MALLGLHVCERGDAHDVRDLRDAADGGGAETVLRLVGGLAPVDGLVRGGAAAVLVHDLINNDALRVQRLREHGPRVGLFLERRSALRAAHGRL